MWFGDLFNKVRVAKSYGGDPEEGKQVCLSLIPVVHVQTPDLADDMEFTARRLDLIPPPSPWGFKMKHATLYALQEFDNAIVAMIVFSTRLSKLDDAGNL